MASASSNEDLGQMECSICTETFTEPRALNCSHIFCETCIQTWILRLSSDLKYGKLTGIECPLCRKITKPPQKSLKLENWASSLRKVSLDEFSKPTIGHKCEPCHSEFVKRPAVFCCMDCFEYQCGECNKTHMKLKATKSHKVVDIRLQNWTMDMDTLKGYQQMLMCDQHPDKAIEFYCEDDESVFCSTCAFVDHRSCDNVVEIKDGTEFDGDPLPKTCRKMENLSFVLSETGGIQKKYHTMIEDDYVNLKRKLQASKQEMIKTIEKAESQLLGQCKVICSKFQEGNQKNLNDVNSLKQSVDSSIKIGKKICAMKVSPKERAIAAKKLEEKTDSFKTQVQECTTNIDGHFKGIHLNPNSEIVRTLQISNIFGTIEQPDSLLKLPSISDDRTLSDITLEYASFQEEYSSKVFKQNSYFTTCTLVGPTGDTCTFVDQRNKRFITLETTTGDTSEHRMKSTPFMVDVDKEDHLVVSLPNEKKILFYDTSGYRVFNEIHTRKTCYGIQIIDSKEIAVSLYRQCDGWSLATYSIEDGNELKVMKSDANGRKFKSLMNFLIFVGDTVVQSCDDENAVFAFKLSNGEPVFQHRHNELNWPTGLDTDHDLNIYVCGLKSHNIHVLSESGDLIRIFKLGPDISPIFVKMSINDEDVIVLGDANAPGPFFFKLK